MFYNVLHWNSIGRAAGLTKFQIFLLFSLNFYQIIILNCIHLCTESICKLNSPRIQTTFDRFHSRLITEIALRKGFRGQNSNSNFPPFTKLLEFGRWLVRHGESVVARAQQRHPTANHVSRRCWRHGLYIKANNGRSAIIRGVRGQLRRANLSLRVNLLWKRKSTKYFKIFS